METAGMNNSAERCYNIVMGVFAAILFVVVFPVFVFIGWTSALFVILYRGPDFVRWRAPRDCVSPLSWAAFEWNYEGMGGRQIGIRALGVEIAYNGLLR